MSANAVLRLGVGTGKKETVKSVSTVLRYDLGAPLVLEKTI